MLVMTNRTRKGRLRLTSKLYTFRMNDFTIVVPRFKLSASLRAMATEEQNASEATDLKDLCREMFDKITQYLNGELTGNACSDKYYRSNINMYHCSH